MQGRRWKMLAAGLALVASQAWGEGRILVAQVAPLSGVLATTGRQMVVGAKIVFDEVNASGGVHGAKIEHRVLDDGYKVNETLRLTRELVAQPDVLALFGFAGTANVGKLLDEKVLAQAGIALVAPYTGGESLRRPFNPWIFHVRASYGDETEHMVQQLTTVGLERIAVLYQDDAFGKAGLAGVEAAVAKRGLTLAAAAGYERNTDKVAGAVKAILAAQPQAVVMIAVNKPAAAFIKAYRDAGGAAQLFNISVVDPAEIVRLAGLAQAQGLGISQVVPYPYTPTLPVVREYQALLKKHAPGEAPNYTSFEEFLGARLLVEGLRRAGPQPTREKLVRALESLRELDLGGFVLRYGPHERIGSTYVEVTIVGRDGRLRK